MRQEIFKQVRDMKVGDRLRLEVNTQSEELRRIRIFAEVAGWEVMCRKDKDTPMASFVTRIS